MACKEGFYELYTLYSFQIPTKIVHGFGAVGRLVKKA